MEIPVTPLIVTEFDSDLGEEGILTIAFTTAGPITYKTGTTLYFYAVITENLVSQTVCFTLSGGANPLPADTYSFTIPNDSDFTNAATAEGIVYYTGV
ncbi:MAG: hypothetical protein ABFC62_06915 [Clostridiaceae bacterium]|nr:hypothetical protein [Eubacteriales bacterium]